MSVEMSRDQVLAGRIGVALQDAKALYDALSILAINPPTTGADQEDRMRGIENSLCNAAYNAKRLQGYTK